MNTDSHLFITGIGTGVGKTVVSAAFMQYFGADYWKPVQAGDLHISDSTVVRRLVDEDLMIHEERYRLRLAASPHQSAAEENLAIRLEDFELPFTSNRLIVEGAGGLMVPLNDKHFVINLAEQLRLPVVLVSRDYLGCINHTILSLQVLQSRNIPIACLVLNGKFNPATREIIIKHIPAGTSVIELPEFTKLNRESIRSAALEIRNQTKQYQHG